MSSTLRSAVVLAGAGTLALSLAPAAQAAAPERIEVPLDQSFESALCADPVQVDVEGRLVASIYGDPVGPATRIRENWQGVKARVTAVETGRSTSFALTGATRITPAPDGETATYRLTGPVLAIGEDPRGGEQGIWLVHGQYTFVQDLDGNMTDADLVGGRVQDVCALVGAD